MNYLTEPGSRGNAAHIGEWVFENSAEWKSAISADPSIFSGLQQSPEEVGWEVIGRAQESPWRSDDLPPLASWVQANSALIDLLVAGSGCSEFYSPLPLPMSPEEDSLLYTLPMNSMMRSRSIARVLITRAMLHLGEGRHEQAWQDLHAIHRWARLVGRGPTLVEQLVAIAIDGIACKGTSALLDSDQLSPELTRQIQADLLALAPPSDMAKSFDEGERLYFVDAIVGGSRQGVGTFLASSMYLEDASNLSALDYISVNWNVTLSQGNAWYDRIAAAFRLPTQAARKRELSNLERDLHALESQLYNARTYATAAISPVKRADTLAAAVISLLTPAVKATLDAENRAKAQLELTRLAAALAIYRAEHHEYPADLSALLPDILPQLPVDLFTGQPFAYQRTADGYLLYSLGENGTDDGGSNELYGGGILAGRALDFNDDPATEKLRQQIPPGADDHALRVPRPKFKLPDPPTLQP